MPLATIIVTSQTEDLLLEKTIESLKTTRGDYQICFVDIESEDTSLDIMKKYQEEHTRIYINNAKKEETLGSIINDALDAVDASQYAIYLAAGMVPQDPEWLNILISKFESEEKLFSVAPTIVSTTDIVVSAGILFSRAFPVYADQGKESTNQRVSQEQPFVCLPAEGTLFKTTVADQKIKFDTNFVEGYVGLDMTLKAYQNGYINLHTPDVKFVDYNSRSRYNESILNTNDDLEYFVNANGGIEALDNLNNAGEYYGSGKSYPSTEYWKNNSEPKAKIVCFLADHQGCGHYRMKNPYRGLIMKGYDVIFTTFSPEEFFEWADVLVFQRQCNDHMWEKIQYAKSLGKKVIYEVDDYFHGLELTNPVTPAYQQNPGWLRNMERIIYHADALTVSTPELAKQYGRFNSNTHIVPNAIDLGMIPNPIKENDDDTIRIGWGGSATHNADISLLRGAIDSVMGKYPKTRLVFLGTDYRPFFPEIPYDRMEWIPSTYNHEDCVGDYYKALNEARIDIGLAPITDSHFNRCKSDVKIIEYGAYGIAVVASNVEPYTNVLKGSGDPEARLGFLAKHESDWIKYLELLVSNRELMLKVGKNLQEYVWTQRGVEHMANQVETIVEDILAGKSHKPNKLEPTHSLNVPYLNNLTSKKAEIYAQELAKLKEKKEEITVT